MSNSLYSASTGDFTEHHFQKSERLACIDLPSYHFLFHPVEEAQWRESDCKDPNGSFRRLLQVFFSPTQQNGILYSSVLLNCSTLSPPYKPNIWVTERAQ